MTPEQERAAIVERLREGNLPRELVDYAALMAEEVAATFRAKIADGVLTVGEQGELMTVALAYRDLSDRRRDLGLEAADLIASLTAENERLREALQATVTAIEATDHRHRSNLEEQALILARAALSNSREEAD